MMKQRSFILIFASIMAALGGLAIAVNVLANTTYANILTMYLGVEPSKSNSLEGVSSEYESKKFSSLKALVQSEEQFVSSFANEGITLLKNEGENLPLKKGTKVSLFSSSSIDFVYGGSGSGASSVGLSTSLKDGLNAAGLSVNETLWDFYAKGAGKSYRRGVGSVNYGAGEDWTIGECPIDTITADETLVASFQNTYPLFVLSRTGGEGMDLARNMAAFGGEEGQHYLELNAVEKGVLSYLNEHFEKITLLLNCNNVFELGFLSDYPHISSALWVPGLGRTGTRGLGEVLLGEDSAGKSLSPSGHLTDTFPADLFSEPSSANMGVFSYDGTSYYYNAYNEGIYIGYRYYETRYEDTIKKRPGVGAFSYDQAVLYPFGYGLSYTTFARSTPTYSLDATAKTLTIETTVKNTGSHAGREVVQIYLQKPYTDYDIAHGIEKSAVELVGFAKTSSLEPAQTETVRIPVSLECLKTYDSIGAKTYIVEEGDYRFVMADNAHEASESLLADQGYSTASSNPCYHHNVPSFDALSYALDPATGKAITNHFEEGHFSGQKFLSRNAWEDTLATLRYGQTSSTSCPANEGGKLFVQTLDSATKAALDSTSSLNPNPQKGALETLKENAPRYLVDGRGEKSSSTVWREFARALSYDDIGNIIAQSGYQIPGADALNMPTSLVVDGPAGLNILPNHDSKPLGEGYYAMAWPCEVAIASSWNSEAAAQIGDYVAEEGLWANTAGWYGPAMNMHRSPFGGRNFEYFSEDPYLAGTLAGSESYAASRRGMTTFIKHFALNEQESHRATNGLISWANEQTIREIYLRPFELSVKMGTAPVKHNVRQSDGHYTMEESQLPAIRGIMTSYNRIGTTWAGGNYHLISDVLRGEWGFEGMVLTDWDVEGYMNISQMLEAGGDAKLNTVGVNRTIGSDAHDSYYALPAIEHILYTVANSLVMNGFTPGQSIIHGAVRYHTILLYVDLGFGALEIGLGLGLFFGLRRRKQRDSENAKKPTC